MSAVLVVEDELAVRRILRLTLARMGCMVAEAESVETAREALQAFGQHFDLILLDLNLPDETGWELLRRLDDWTPKAPDSDTLAPRPAVIVMTAVRPAQSRMEEFRPAGLLLKPFPIEALIRQVERALSRPTVTG
ncbi:MAG TPA: response regulator [Ktedonobacterales bacterium]|nr:response regulator [Ktedonobacterales bacterium]